MYQRGPILYPGFQSPRKTGETEPLETSSCLMHPLRSHYPILVYSVIGQVILILTTQCFGSTSNSCERGESNWSQ